LTRHRASGLSRPSLIFVELGVRAGPATVRRNLADAAQATRRAGLGQPRPGRDASGTMSDMAPKRPGQRTALPRLSRPRPAPEGLTARSRGRSLRLISSQSTMATVPSWPPASTAAYHALLEELTMDDDRFDAIARRLVVSAGRRGVLRGLGASALVGVFGTRLADEAAAGAVRCKNTGCNRLCRNAIDSHGNACRCGLLVDGRSVCHTLFCGVRCDKNSDCSRRAVCSRTAKNCCGRTNNAKGTCVSPCRRGNPEP